MKENKNYLLKVKEIFLDVLEEINLLETPSIWSTIKSTIYVLLICTFLCIFFILVGEITIKLLKLIGL